MSVKQDQTYTRTAAALEQKYNFGKKFSEVIGLVDESQKRVDSVQSTLSNEILEQSTSLTRNAERIVMSAMENYETIGEAEKKREELKAELIVEAGKISMEFDEQLEERVDGVDTKVEDIKKNFDFNANGLTIRAGESELKLRIDNNMIAFYKGEIDERDLSKNRLGWWDGDNFYTGNIKVDVNERAQFGNFAFVPRSNGSLSFLKVGG